MNTVGSVYYGWAWLIVAGAGSYYFAKRSINADRDQRHALEVEQRMARNRYIAEQSEFSARQSALKKAGEHDKAEAEMRSQKKSKWEAKEPYRSPKGDRFS